MDTESFARAYFKKLSGAIHSLDFPQWDEAVDLIADAWEQGQFIYTFGNGGSGATASHFAMDWGKSISLATGKKMKVVCLNDNTPVILAYANDLSYDCIFIEQLKNLLRPGDLVIGISGSGNSENVIRAIEYANQNGAVTLGLCGYDGGRLRKLAQHSVWVDIPDMQVVEDMHLSFCHVVMQKLISQNA